jgi:hypothetical protein
VKGDELDRATFDGFSLAVRVILQAFEIDEPGSEFEKPWLLLRDVAQGRTTLTTAPELAARFPHLRDFLYDRVNRMIESDRETALRVLRGLSASF